jgi:hypothetical protein
MHPLKWLPYHWRTNIYTMKGLIYHAILIEGPKQIEQRPHAPYKAKVSIVDLTWTSELGLDDVSPCSLYH